MAQPTFHKRFFHVNILNSADLMDLPDWARIAWFGMILRADDEGRILHDSYWIRTVVWPGSSRTRGPLGESQRPPVHKLDKLWTVLEQRRCITRTEVDGIKYYQLTNFKRYNPSRARQDGEDGEERRERRGGAPPPSSLKVSSKPKDPATDPPYPNESFKEAEARRAKARLFAKIDASDPNLKGDLRDKTYDGTTPRDQR